MLISAVLISAGLFSTGLFSYALFSAGLILNGLISVGLCCSLLCCSELFSAGRKSLWHSCTNRPFAGESVWQNLVFGPENTVLGSFIFPCNTGWKQPLLSLCSTHSVIPYFSSFSSLTCTNMVPPFLLLCAASSSARQITIQRPALPLKSVVTDSHYIVYMCESRGRHTLTIFKRA